MKINYVIHEKYKEAEIHVCADELTDKIRSVAAVIEEAVNVTVPGYDENGVTMLPYESIIRFYSENQRVYAQTKEKRYAIKYRLYELETNLGQEKFVRISNSEMVNIKQILRLDTKLTGTIHIYLKNDIETYVSRRYVTKIKKVLGV